MGMSTKLCPAAHDYAVFPASMTAHGQWGQDLQYPSVQLKVKLINGSLPVLALCPMYMIERDKVNSLPELW